MINGKLVAQRSASDHVGVKVGSGCFTVGGSGWLACARGQKLYGSGKSIRIPDDLQAAIDARPQAKLMLEKLTAQNRFALAFRIHTVKTGAARWNKIETFVEMFERDETIYPQRNK